MVGSEDLDQEILSKQLRQLGLEVRCVPNGSAAMDELTMGFRPQIVMINERLPDTTGADLAAAMRQAGLHSATVLLCADKHSVDSSTSQASVDAVLARPILRNDLFHTLACLAKHPAVGHHAPEQVPEKTPKPLADPEEASPKAEVPAFLSRRHSRPVPAKPAPRQMRVLAAEDNRTNQFVLSKLVKALDIDLVFASNGIEAVELYRNFEPDLVFMDISMPEMDGKQATREIRKIEAGRAHVPIVAMTAHALAGDKEEILDAGLDHYLTKPMQKAVITAVIREACPAECRAPDDAPAVVAE